MYWLWSTSVKQASVWILEKRGMEINITQKWLKYDFNVKNPIDRSAWRVLTEHLLDTRSLPCSCLKHTWGDGTLTALSRMINLAAGNWRNVSADLSSPRSTGFLHRGSGVWTQKYTVSQVGDRNKFSRQEEWFVQKHSSKGCRKLRGDLPQFATLPEHNRWEEIPFSQSQDCLVLNFPQVIEFKE